MCSWLGVRRHKFWQQKFLTRTELLINLPGLAIGWLTDEKIIQLTSAEDFKSWISLSVNIKQVSLFTLSNPAHVVTQIRELSSIVDAFFKQLHKTHWRQHGSVLNRICKAEGKRLWRIMQPHSKDLSHWEDFSNASLGLHLKDEVSSGADWWVESSEELEMTGVKLHFDHLFSASSVKIQ